jgi:hypothetical protein
VVIDEGLAVNTTGEAEEACDVLVFAVAAAAVTVTFVAAVTTPSGPVQFKI